MGKKVLTHFIGQGCRGSYVTHLKELTQAHAERETSGRCTFRMIQHEPELTSFGMDLYNSIIGS